jgi:hypothetical protein
VGDTALFIFGHQLQFTQFRLKDTIKMLDLITGDYQENGLGLEVGSGSEKWSFYTTFVNNTS